MMVSAVSFKLAISRSRRDDDRRRLLRIHKFSVSSSGAVGEGIQASLGVGTVASIGAGVSKFALMVSAVCSAS